MFIALEGIDGSGKGTHSKLLNRWVKEKGYDTVLTKEPTESAVGKLIRQAIKRGGLDPKTEALLFAADRSEHVREINSKLADGKVVITERYLFSSIAYQAASGVSVEWIKEINKFATMPDVVFYLDILPEAGLKRISSKNTLRSIVREKEYFERCDFLNKVRAIYLGLTKDHENFVVIDASGPIDDVQTIMRRKVSRLLREREEKKRKTSQKVLREYMEGRP